MLTGALKRRIERKKGCFSHRVYNRAVLALDKCTLSTDSQSFQHTNIKDSSTSPPPISRLSATPNSFSRCLPPPPLARKPHPRVVLRHCHSNSSYRFPVLRPELSLLSHPRFIRVSFIDRAECKKDMQYFR